MSSLDPRVERLHGANHALLCGLVFSACVRMAAEEPERDDGLETSCELIDFDDGAHAATFRVRRPSGAYLVSVVPE